jgi:hypothetical protein
VVYLDVEEQEEAWKRGADKGSCAWWAIDAALTYGTWKQSWQAPEPEWIKCKVDATFQAGNGSAASGVVLRDHGGMPNMWGHS